MCPLNFNPSNHKFSTVILFWVRVPVLSEQIHDLSLINKYVDPKVSTPSKFLTNTFFAANFLAVNDNATVTVANIPHGTYPIMIPVQNNMLVRASNFKN